MTVLLDLFQEKLLEANDIIKIQSTCFLCLKSCAKFLRFIWPRNKQIELMNKHSRKLLSCSFRVRHLNPKLPALLQKFFFKFDCFKIIYLLILVKILICYSLLSFLMDGRVSLYKWWHWEFPCHWSSIDLNVSFFPRNLHLYLIQGTLVSCS